MDIYDYERACYVSGSGDGGNFRIYDHGNGRAIHITFNKNNFTGFDEHTSAHFRGIVTGNLVSIFDYGQSNWFRYNV